VSYHLLDTFRQTFDGQQYLHRRSGLGDLIAMQLFEDLYDVGRSTLLQRRIEQKERVLNVGNRRRGIKARRGDGTFGEIIPGVSAVADPGFKVARGAVATVEIGVEVKILAKAMLKQIDRVIGDLQKQVEHFKRGAGNPICVGVVGVNHAAVCTGYEGDRAFTTDGVRHRHPYQEAQEAERRLVGEAKPCFNEFLVVAYKATNAEPYPFDWLNREAAVLDYGAILARISREYDRRFRNGNGGR
jgi:hypothetical protein